MANIRAAARAILVLGLLVPSASDAAPAIAMHGAPAYPDGFDHFPYVNPAAPKGGRLTLSLTGTFDSLNPFIVHGSATPFLRGTVVESLLARSYAEPFTLYGLLASGVDTDAARSFVTFTLDPRARFSDGVPVTAEDVLFSFALLRDKGRPNYRFYYTQVSQAEALDGRTVRFTFAAPDRELPLIMGLMPVLPRHATDAATFDSTSLTAPVGSGPYVVSAVQPGASVTLSRNPAYWGWDLPVNQGLYNFDELRYEYFRDGNTEFEAFKRGLVDARFETDPTRWETGYDFPAVRDGAVIKETLPTALPKPHYALVFNTRRAIFADIRVRRAIIELMDFPWINRALFHGLYARTTGVFDGSELSSLQHPASQAERALLAHSPRALPREVMEGTYVSPEADGTGRDRAQLRRALELFAEAGWSPKDGVLTNADGAPFRFTLMVTTREQERLTIAFASQLARAGIDARIQMVDAVQFDARRASYDFDMVPFTWVQSLSPGHEQAFYFGSQAAGTPGTRNYMGMKDPAADAAIEALAGAVSRADLQTAARAIDRVLIAGAYGVPLFYAPGQWLARWSAIRRPGPLSLYGTLPDTWWRAPAP